jgi:hypothetical protein
VKRVGTKPIEQEALGLKATFQQNIKALLSKANKSPSKKMYRKNSTQRVILQTFEIKRYLFHNRTRHSFSNL